MELTQKDVDAFLIKNTELKECPCPGCLSEDSVLAFSKFGLKYVECQKCYTVYISPRPDDRAIHRYYEQASSMIFWRERLSTLTSQKRKEKILAPRFQWVLESTREYLPNAHSLIDIHTNQQGYIEEMQKDTFFDYKILINPFLSLNMEKKNPKIKVLRTSLDEVDIKREASVVCIFEALDHTSNVETLFHSVHEMLQDGGLCFITGILISGFDLQVLWDKADNLYPPDRLNVFSVEGLKTLFERCRFECLEFSTPGVLDLEIITKKIFQGSQAQLPRFLKYVLKNRDEEIKRSFQKFLQSALLSSYGRILLRKQ